MKIKKIIILLFWSFILMVFTSNTVEASGKSKIHILPFPGSDAILLESNGCFGMVDSGEDWDYPAGNDNRYPDRVGISKGAGYDEKVIEYLKAVGVTNENFDFYIGTHPHSDHIGTADDVIRTFIPKRVYVMEYKDEYISNPNALWDNLYVYDRLIAAAKDVNATLIQNFDSSVSDEDSSPIFYLGDMKIEVFNYSDDYKTERKKDANAFALGVKITVNGKSAFLASDIGEVYDGDETKLAPIIGEVDLLKMGHHGLSSSNTPYFLEVLSPEIAVQTGSYAAIPKDRYEMFDKMNTQFFTVEAYQNMLKALVFEFAQSGIITNLSDTSYFGKANRSPHLTYYFNGYKEKRTGFEMINGHFYYFNDNCYCEENVWLKLNDKYYYFDENGVMSTGWRNIDDVWYYMDDQGIMQTGWIYENGHWYYLNEQGAMQTGWIYENGCWYYLNGAGVMLTNTWVGDYYLGTNGGMLTDAWIDNYYVGSDGRRIKGTWLKDLNWWYRHGDGSYTTNGWESIDGSWYYFDETGYMVTGWRKVNGKWYYMNGSGAMLSNRWIGDYYLGADGAMLTNAWIGNYYVGGDGRWIVNTWIKGYNWWYRHGDGSYTTNGWESIDGSWYYFDETGYMVTGWRQVNGKWYYMNGSGAMLSNRWLGDYYLGADGAMQTNAWIGKYYVGGDGRWIANRWIKGYNWWYRHGDGSYTTNGWESIDGTWYYFDETGYMVTGWRQVNGKWYYMNGSGAMLANRWIGDYYLGTDGAMVTNTWIDGYFLGEDGRWIRNISYTEASVVDLVNDVRAKVGLAPLSFATNVAEAADVRARELQQVFSHNRPDGTSCFTVLDEFVIKYEGAGENIAAGQRTANEVMNDWINSSGHYENIIGDFTHIAVGHYKGTDGVDYWVQLFIK